MTSRLLVSRRLLVLVCITGAVALAVASMPPGAVMLPSSQEIAEPVRGAVHVHSRQSDGTGTLDEIAKAAARAGLTFVVITDHGDGTREPEPPSYRFGVLCIDAVEVTTTGGHLVALGLWSRTPYPLGGEPRDVVEDVARLGGMSVAAHPSSKKPSFRWTDWSTPVDGLEWLNADSEWRDEDFGSLARALFTYPWRKPETLAALLDRPMEALRRWDALVDRRRIVGFAAADAHASLGIGTESIGGNGRWHLKLPAYEQVFRAFSVALPALRLTGDAVSDARAVVREIRDGHLFSSIDGFASPARLSFTASSGARTASPGDELSVDGPVTIRVASPAPRGARIALLARGREVASALGPTLQYDAPPARAAYRVEVRLSGASPGGSEVPWLLSNPIYVGGFPEAATPPATPGERAPCGVEQRSEPDWSVEKNEESRADFDVVRTAREGAGLLFRYALRASTKESPWAALVMRSIPDLRCFDRVMFAARADKPMRLWVQLRTPAPATVLYWHRSVYIDPTERQISVRFDDMRPIGDAAGGTPALAHAESILFVIDQTHTALGDGRVWLDDIRYGR